LRVPSIPPDHRALTGRKHRPLVDLAQRRVASVNRYVLRRGSRVIGIRVMDAETSERLDGIDQRLGGMDQRFDGIDLRLGALDQKVDEKFDDSKRYFGVRVERLEGKLDLIAEGYRDTDRRLGEFRAWTETAIGSLDRRVM